MPLLDIQYIQHTLTTINTSKHTTKSHHQPSIIHYITKSFGAFFSTISPVSVCLTLWFSTMQSIHISLLLTHAHTKAHVYRQAGSGLDKKGHMSQTALNNHSGGSVKKEMPTGEALENISLPYFVKENVHLIGVFFSLFSLFTLPDV